MQKSGPAPGCRSWQPAYLRKIMRANKRALALGLFLLTLIHLSSCGQLIGNDKATPTPSSDPTGNSVELVSTPTPLLSSSSTPLLITTAIPTLSTEGANAKLLDLLSNNGNCQLPCLWGITPGKSKYQEAQTALMPLSGISNRTAFQANGGLIDLLYIENELILNARVNFLSDGQIVKSIRFEADEERKITTPSGGVGFTEVFDSVDFGRRANYFMLPHVLTEQGRPDAVVISTAASPNTRNGTIVGGFDIILLYPGQGLLVHYTTQMQLVGKQVHGCMASAHVELELYPSGKRDSFAEYLAPTKWAGMWPPPNNLYWKPIERATTMTLDQFYEIFRHPTKNCIETPANLWPKPES